MKKISTKKQLQWELDKKERIKMKLFFLYIWHRWDKKSEISGTPVYGEPSTIYHHHILEKRNYPELRYCEENIISLTWDEHQSVEANPTKYEKINKIRNKILNKIDYYSKKALKFEKEVLEPLYELHKDKY